MTIAPNLNEEFLVNFFRLTKNANPPLLNKNTFGSLEENLD